MSEIRATFDVSVLVLPSNGNDCESTSGYVESLLCWKQLLDASLAEFFLSAYACEDLFEADCFPLRTHLGNLLSNHGLAERFDANTLFSFVDFLLNKLSHIESLHCIDYVLLRQFSTEPDVLHAVKENSALCEHRKRMIVIHALLHEHCSVVNHPLVLPQEFRQPVVIDSILEDIDHRRDDLSMFDELPCRFGGEVHVCHDLASLVQCLDDAILLRDADNVHAVAVAIRLAYWKKNLKDTKPFEWSLAPEFGIGKDFHSSYKDLNPSADIVLKILRAAVATLEDEIRHTHHLRENRSGNSRVRRRIGDQAQAWRRDIDEEHHLHYWKRSDGFVEFANVAFPHDNFAITE